MGDSPEVDNIQDYSTLPNFIIESDAARCELFLKKMVEAKIWCSFTDKSEFWSEDYLSLFANIFINFTKGKQTTRRDAYSFVRAPSEATAKRRVQKAIDNGFILFKGSDGEWKDKSTTPNDENDDKPTTEIMLSDHILAHCRLYADYASGVATNHHPAIIDLTVKLLAKQ